MQKKSLKLPGPPVLPDAAIIVPDQSEYSLHIAGVYQDIVTRDWAMQTCQRATQLAGKERIQNKWFSAHSLSDHENLLEAVRAALAADVIVVSVYAVEELPIDLYVWIDAWLPRRISRIGALAAVIGGAEPQEPLFVRTREYLQAVAHKAQLDFIPQQRQHPVASSPFSQPVNLEMAMEPGKGCRHNCMDRFRTKMDSARRK